MSKAINATEMAFCSCGAYVQQKGMTCKICLYLDEIVRITAWMENAREEARVAKKEIELLRQDLGLAFDERDEARSELYRLRKLCARIDAAIHAPYAMAWGDTLAEEIREAAGKGE